MPRSAASALDCAEAALEFCGGAAQRGFGLDVELAREVGDREQHVAHLFLQRRLRRVVVDLVLDFGDLLLDLVDDRVGIRPVEADRARRGARSWRRATRRGGRAPPRRARSLRRRLACRSAALCASQASFCGRDRGDLGVAEDMRMAPHHLVGDRRGDVVEREHARPPRPCGRGTRPAAAGRPVRPSAPRCRRARSHRRPRRPPRSCRARSSRNPARGPTGSRVPGRAAAP